MSGVTSPVEVFFSYVHKDESFRDDLAKYLSLLERQGLIKTWSDRSIGPAQELEAEISAHLDSAGLILLLVSADYLASDYVWSVELQRALARQDAGAVRVIPIILRPCDWQSAPFGRLEPLPKGGKPITTWSNRDAAFVDVVRGIRDAVVVGEMGSAVGSAAGGDSSADPEEMPEAAPTPSDTQPEQDQEAPAVDAPASPPPQPNPQGMEQLEPRKPAAQPLAIAARCLADTPSEVDWLGFADYAEALADFIQNDKTQKPLTVGIDAAWGMGKTTLMHMIEQRLRTSTKRPGALKRIWQQIRRQPITRVGAHAPLPTVWFNAWKYDQEETLWAALILAILEEIRLHATLGRRIRTWFGLNRRRLNLRLLAGAAGKALLYLGGLAILAAVIYWVGGGWLSTQGRDKFLDLWKTNAPGVFGVAGLLTFSYTLVRDFLGHLARPFDLRISEYLRTPDYRKRIGFLAEMEEDFARVVESVTSNGKWPLVVFIDDLDRCAPANVAQILEAKIIQINFHIPAADPELIQSFIDGNLRVLLTPPGEVAADKAQVAEAENLINAEQRAGKSLDQAVAAVSAKRTDLAEAAVIQAERAVFARSFDDTPQVVEAIHEAAPYLGYNPRKIKRFINNFRLQAFVANRRGLLQLEGEDLRLLARSTILAMRWPDILSTAASDSEFAAHLLEAAQRANSDSSPKTPRRKRGTGSQESPTDTSRIERLVTIRDFRDLLGGMGKMTPDKLRLYLQVAQTTGTSGRPLETPEKAGQV